MNNKYDVGIIVGRFQVPDLHEAHKKLIQSVCDNHQKVIVFLGLSSIFDSNDPLDFEARKKMLTEAFPEIILAYIKDMPDDKLWSAYLDDQIRCLLNPNQTAILYGGRDSFIERYHGKFPTEEIRQDVWVSGTQIRAMVKNSVKSTRDFRHGAIWQSWQRFPTVYPTVDIAVVDFNKQELLLGQKMHESLWRFVGGFADPSDESYEAAALRELGEEVPNIEVGGLPEIKYIGSCKIDDWRYRGKIDKIITHLFVVPYKFGNPMAGDDLAKTAWFKLSDLDESKIVGGHRPLLKMLQNYLTSLKKSA